MRTKKESLIKLGEKIDLSVEGLENYDNTEPTLIVANHRCMKDIFALSLAVPDPCKLIMSSRLMWKRDSPEKAIRRRLIEESLHGIPLEVHGGKERLELGLNMAKIALSENWSVGIFPEGAYIPDNQVNRGRTGASRVLFESKHDSGIEAKLLPVAINYLDGIDEDLDSYDFRGDRIKVTFCEPVNYSNSYTQYIEATDNNERKQALKTPVDIAMRSIARVLGVPYKHEYVEIYKRETMVLEDGNEVPIEAIYDEKIKSA